MLLVSLTNSHSQAALSFLCLTAALAGALLVGPGAAPAQAGAADEPAPAGVPGTEAAPSPFLDVPEGHGAYEAIAHLAAAGLVQGYPDGTFGGSRTLTRYEAAMIFSRMLARLEALEEKLAQAPQRVLERVIVEKQPQVTERVVIEQPVGITDEVRSAIAAIVADQVKAALAARPAWATEIQRETEALALGVASTARRADRAVQAAAGLEGRVESLSTEIGRLGQSVAAHLAAEAAKARDEAERRATAPRLTVSAGATSSLAGDRPAHGYVLDTALTLERGPLRGQLGWGVRASSEGKGGVRGSAGLQVGRVRMLGANLSFGGEMIASSGSFSGIARREFVSLAWEPRAVLTFEVEAGWQSGVVPDPVWPLRDVRAEAGYAWASLSWHPGRGLPALRAAVGRVWPSGSVQEPAAAWLVGAAIPVPGDEAGGGLLKLQLSGVAGRPPQSLLVSELAVEL